MTFKRVLLNTCQEEFEGAQEAREVTSLHNFVLLEIQLSSHHLTMAWCRCLTLGFGLTQALKSTPDEDREAAERKVKMRTLGNIRLIAELYKQDVVSEKILHACIQSMLGDGKSDPVEDDVEVLCCHLFFSVLQSVLPSRLSLRIASNRSCVVI